MAEVPRPMTSKVKLHGTVDRQGGTPWGWRVCCVPDWVPQHYAWALVVEPRGPASEAPDAPEGWAITNGGLCMSVDFEWDVEPSASSRTVKFLRAHRWYDAQAAMVAARKEARRIEVNGLSPAQVIERFKHLDPDARRSDGGRRIGGRLAGPPTADDVAEIVLRNWGRGERAPLE